MRLEVYWVCWLCWAGECVCLGYFLVTKWPRKKAWL